MKRELLLFKTVIRKDFTLNSVTLLNEAIGLYITHYIKKFSPSILKYFTLVGEKNSVLTITKEKDFFV